MLINLKCQGIAFLTAAVYLAYQVEGAYPLPNVNQTFQKVFIANTGLCSCGVEVGTQVWLACDMNDFGPGYGIFSINQTSMINPVLRTKFGPTNGLYLYNMVLSDGVVYVQGELNAGQLLNGQGGFPTYKQFFVAKMALNGSFLFTTVVNNVAQHMYAQTMLVDRDTSQIYVAASGALIKPFTYAFNINNGTKVWVDTWGGISAPIFWGPKNVFQGRFTDEFFVFGTYDYFDSSTFSLRVFNTTGKSQWVTTWVFHDYCQSGGYNKVKKEFFAIRDSWSNIFGHTPVGSADYFVDTIKFDELDSYASLNGKAPFKTNMFGSHGQDIPFSIMYRPSVDKYVVTGIIQGNYKDNTYMSKGSADNLIIQLFSNLTIDFVYLTGSSSYDEVYKSFDVFDGDYVLSVGYELQGGLYFIYDDPSVAKHLQLSNAVIASSSTSSTVGIKTTTQTVYSVTVTTSTSTFSVTASTINANIVTSTSSIGVLTSTSSSRELTSTSRTSLLSTVSLLTQGPAQNASATLSYISLLTLGSVSQSRLASSYALSSGTMLTSSTTDQPFSSQIMLTASLSTQSYTPQSSSVLSYTLSRNKVVATQTTDYLFVLSQVILSTFKASQQVKSGNALSSIATNSQFSSLLLSEMVPGGIITLVAVSAGSLILVMGLCIFYRFRKGKQFKRSEINELRLNEEFTTLASSTLMATALVTAHEISVPAYMEVFFGVDFRPLQQIAVGGGGSISHCEILNRSKFPNDVKLVFKNMLQKVSAMSETQKSSFYTEVALINMLRDQPQFARMYGFTHEPAGILLKYYHLGSLKPYIFSEYKGPKYTKVQVLYIIHQICVGLRYLHMKGFAHNDVKPDNILLELGLQGLLEPRITDFGISRLADRTTVVGVEAFQFSCIRGLSLYYASPEAFLRLRERSSTQVAEDFRAADVYSTAIVMIEILSRKRSWDPVFQ